MTAPILNCTSISLALTYQPPQISHSRKIFPTTSPDGPRRRYSLIFPSNSIPRRKTLVHEPGLGNPFSSDYSPRNRLPSALLQPLSGTAPRLSASWDDISASSCPFTYSRRDRHGREFIVGYPKCNDQISCGPKSHLSLSSIVNLTGKLSLCCNQPSTALSSIPYGDGGYRSLDAAG